MYSCLLGFMEQSESHTASDTSLKIQNVLNRYSGLKIICATTDNANSMKNACVELNISHHMCFLHSIQLIVNAAIVGTSKIKETYNK